MENLNTIQGEGVIPHSYYPRPTFARDSFMTLNGAWDFSASKKYAEPIYNEKITVPFVPECALSGIGRSMDKTPYLFYRRNLTIPEGFNKGRIILHFGAVDQECRVYINGSVVGENFGGYLPFSFDITDYLRGGENTLEVHVKDNLSKKYPYGKQRKKRGGMWYTPISGIWQSVWLESVPDVYIRSIKMTPDLNGVKLNVAGGEIHKRIILKDNDEIFEFDGDEFYIQPKNIRTWSPEDPYLYYFKIECGDDLVESYFALREVGAQIIDGIPRLTLNGKPYIFNGLLDQGYFSDGIYTPKDENQYLDDIKLAKSLGFNMLRKHIKIEPEIFYYFCDKEGIAVFQDMVNNGGYSFIRDTALPTIGLQKLSDTFLHPGKKARRIFIETMKKTADLLYNFPSVVYYTIFNEGWGQFSADKAYLILKDKDKTRIIDSTSGWFRRTLSDVDSRHIYFKPIKVKDVNQKPLVISEFGGYSHLVDKHFFGQKSYGYRICDSREKFENDFFELYLNEVIPSMEKGACAFVYTQLSDVEDETNGLTTYDRCVTKIQDTEKCKAIMSRLKL